MSAVPPVLWNRQGLRTVQGIDAACLALGAPDSIGYYPYPLPTTGISSA